LTSCLLLHLTSAPPPPVPPGPLGLGLQEDPGLQRGRPLQLHTAAYAQLSRLWAEAALDFEVLTLRGARSMRLWLDGAAREGEAQGGGVIVEEGGAGAWEEEGSEEEDREEDEDEDSDEEYSEAYSEEQEEEGGEAADMQSGEG